VDQERFHHQRKKADDDLCAMCWRRKAQGQHRLRRCGKIFPQPQKNSAEIQSTQPNLAEGRAHSIPRRLIRTLPHFATGSALPTPRWTEEACKPPPSDRRSPASANKNICLWAGT
jgi:hypothetical protein